MKTTYGYKTQVNRINNIKGNTTDKTDTHAGSHNVEKYVSKEYPAIVPKTPPKTPTTPDSINKYLCTFLIGQPIDRMI